MRLGPSFPVVRRVALRVTSVAYLYLYLHAPHRCRPKGRGV